jgi:hypothetical protein
MNRLIMRSILAQKALELIPPLISRALLESTTFCDEYSLQTDGVISFSGVKTQFQQSDLFAAIRKVLSGTESVVVFDIEEKEWELKQVDNYEEGLTTLALFQDKQQLDLPNFAALSPDSPKRLRFFDQAALDVNLPNTVIETWRSILLNRALKNDEFEPFQNEFLETPMSIMQSLHNEIASGQIKISTLVPHSRRYFERLVGSYDGSSSIQDYATGNGKSHLAQLALWHPYDGFLLSLYLSSHSSLTAEINVERLGNEDLIRALDFLDKYGDRISQLGAIEVGLRVLQSRPEIEPFLIRLIEQIRDEKVDGHGSQLDLLSSLFIFVDGELSRSRLLSAEPPFYRRLAALAQAALIQRQLLNSDIDIQQFGKWAFENRAVQFYMQTYTDMRLEPRWNPDLAVSSQIKDNFIGRIIISANNNRMNIENNRLNDLIFSSESGSLLSLTNLLNTYLPGLLEGGEQFSIPLPSEIAEIIEAQLSEKDIEPSSFVALLNSAMIFHLSPNHAEIAAKVLKLANYRLKNIEDRSQLLTVLNGLAIVAAVTRSSTLSEELRIIMRIYRRDPQYSLTIEETMRLCLIAAASHVDLNDWRAFAGDWLTELAFDNFDGDDGQVLYSNLHCILHAAPELWVTCGRADAALSAYNSI